MRAVLLAAFGLYLLIGPVVRDIAGVKVPRGFQRWQMFVGKAIETCQVRVSVVSVDGSIEPLDLRPRRLEGTRWRVERKQLRGLERRACALARRSRQRPDVRVWARCGSRRRWITERNGMTNVCARRR